MKALRMICFMGTILEEKSSPRLSCWRTLTDKTWPPKSFVFLKRGLARVLEVGPTTMGSPSYLLGPMIVCPNQKHAARGLLSGRKQKKSMASFAQPLVALIRGGAGWGLI